MNTTTSLLSRLPRFIGGLFGGALLGVPVMLFAGWSAWSLLLIGGVVGLLMASGHQPETLVADGHTGGEWTPMKDDERTGGPLLNLDGSAHDGSGDIDASSI